MPGLGRLYIPDDRDEEYPMASVLPATVPGVTYRYWWPSGWWGDQGNTPRCVAYAWLHKVADGPATNIRPNPVLSPREVYCEAQRLDPWEGDCDNHKYDGTSVRAGAKVLQSAGYIKEYRWAWNVNTIVEALLTVGPVVVGTRWSNSMFQPDDKGLITVGDSGNYGHAYVLNGVNVNREIFRMKNSWGRGWGRNGHAYISFKDMARLMNENGEACLPVV